MSSDPRPDPTTDRLIAAALRPRETSGGACLDAETLAAWADGGLDLARAATVEAHLSECARCQSMMVAFAGTDPVPASAAHAVPAVAGSAVVLPMRPRSPMRWLVPAMAAAAAAGLLAWTAWPAFRSAAPAPPLASTMALATPQAAAEIAAPPPVSVPPPVPAQPPASRGAQAASVTPKPEARRETAAPLGAVQGGAAATRSGDAAPPVAARANPGQAASIPGAVPTPLPAAPPRATPPSATPTTTPPPIRADTPTVSTTVSADFIQTLPRKDRNALGFVPQLPGTMVEFAAQAAGSGLAQTAGARSTGGGGRGGAGAAAVSRQSSLIRWRIQIEGPISRSVDAGATWNVVKVEAPATITNGVAPSDDVCWLIGRQGVVLRSTDGASFTRIAFPDASDLGEITATDARHARITVLDGRVFITTDGGATWRQEGGPQGSRPSPF